MLFKREKNTAQQLKANATQKWIIRFNLQNFDEINETFLIFVRPVVMY